MDYGGGGLLWGLLWGWGIIMGMCTAEISPGTKSAVLVRGERQVGYVCHTMDLLPEKKRLLVKNYVARHDMTPECVAHLEIGFWVVCCHFCDVFSLL